MAVLVGDGAGDRGALLEQRQIADRLRLTRSDEPLRAGQRRRRRPLLILQRPGATLSPGSTWTSKCAVGVDLHGVALALLILRPTPQAAFARPTPLGIPIVV